MPELAINDLTPERFDTVILAGADMHGRCSAGGCRRGAS
jgi:hypothetical protein